MRYARLLSKTLPHVPRDVRAPSYRLLYQGGYIRPVGQGLFSLTPLAMRVMRNIRRIIHEEMVALGGQEVQTPLVNPPHIWEASGRDRLVARDMVHFRDRNGRELVLAPTHEEAMVELVRQTVRSYRDLPLFLYQFQTKFRDEERTRCGLVRVREFIMADAYSFHRSFTDLNGFFPLVFAAYRRIFDRCSVPVTAARAGVGYMAGEASYEFLMPCACGDDFLVRCDACGYAANEEIAVGIKEDAESATPQPLQRQSMPDARSLNAARMQLNMPRSRMLKAMVYRSVGGLVMAVVRGDHEVSEEKLSLAVGAQILGPAAAADLQHHGLIGPWLSPIDLPESFQERATVVYDDAAIHAANLVAAANAPSVVVYNVNPGRDLSLDRVTDVVRVPDGAPCRHCNTGHLHRVRAMELGNIFRLGDYYTRAMGLALPGDRDAELYPHMGSYGIGLGRLMSAIVEANRDARGIIWPAAVAPYAAYLMSIGRSPSVRDIAIDLERRLGDQVLFDDRHESISHKLKDADLLGMPLRLVVSRRTVEDGTVEVAVRDTGETTRVPCEALPALVARYGSSASCPESPGTPVATDG